MMNIPTDTNELIFPDPRNADEDGLVAMGGDLSVERLCFAYRNGIFPWYSDGYPILWWSLDPRFILNFEDFHIPKSLKKSIRKNLFEIKFDHDFESVIRNCAEVNRSGQDSTWITEEMILAYIELHKAGFAHSVESYYEGELVGGLYGVSIGKMFAGESMFAKKSDASKVAFVKLVERLKELNFDFIDCQQPTENLARFGAREVARDYFLNILKETIDKETTFKF